MWKSAVSIKCTSMYFEFSRQNFEYAKVKPIIKRVFKECPKLFVVEKWSTSNLITVLFLSVLGYPTEVLSTTGKVWTELRCTSCGKAKNIGNTVCVASSTLKIGQHGGSKMPWRTTTADTFMKSFQLQTYNPLRGRSWWDTNRYSRTSKFAKIWIFARKNWIWIVKP